MLVKGAPGIYVTIVELVASVGENGPLLCMWENVIGHVTLVAIDGTIILVPYLLT